MKVLQVVCLLMLAAAHVSSQSFGDVPADYKPLVDRLRQEIGKDGSMGRLCGDVTVCKGVSEKQKAKSAFSKCVLKAEKKSCVASLSWDRGYHSDGALAFIGVGGGVYMFLQFSRPVPEVISTGEVTVYVCAGAEVSIKKDKGLAFRCRVEF